MPAPRPQRPVLAGNSKAAIDVLDLMLQLWNPAQILVLAPPCGRLHSWQPSLAEQAERSGVEVIAPADANQDQIVRTLGDRDTDLLLSVYYTQIFSTSFLGVVRGPRLNFHPSLLPRRRGTAPLIWAIAEGDPQSGVTVHELTHGVDTGPVLWQRPLPIHPDDTGFSLHLKAAALVRSIAADLLRRLQLERALPDAVAQSGPSSVHTSRDPQLNRIDWRQSSERIRNVVRALAWPLPGAETSWRGTSIGLDQVTISRVTVPTAAPGLVERTRDGEVTVVTGSGAVRLDRVRIGGESQPAGALIAAGVRPGDVLT